MGEDGRDFRRAQLARVAQAEEADEAPGPIDGGLLGADRCAARADGVAQSRRPVVQRCLTMAPRISAICPSSRIFLSTMPTR